MYRLGIDVGGTNTDCAILDEQLQCLYKIKSPTLENVSEGISQAIKKILSESRIAPEKISAAMLGTTHCTNAIVQRKDLSRIGIIRLGAPATTAVNPLLDWPEELLERMDARTSIASGGYEYNGALINPIDKEELQRLCDEMSGKVDAVAVVGVFSPVNEEQEREAAALISQQLGVPVTLSSTIGSIGLLERENASALNAALTATISQMIQGFKTALGENSIEAQMYICQNDGTLMSTEKALAYPVLTIGCGPTNSIRGAAHLSGLADAVVVDIGGTTTDIGVLKNGFPRQSSLATTIGGIRTNFRMPDVLAIGLGGGTIVKEEDAGLTVGPESLGYQLVEKGLSFGGDTLCTTDVFLANRESSLIQGAASLELSESLVSGVKEKIKEMIENAVDQMKTSSEPVPVILVGGGSILAPDELSGVSEVIVPANHDAANAIGAALGEVSGEVNSVYSLEEMTQEEAVALAVSQAEKQAEESGAAPTTIEVISVEVIPIAYLPKQAANIKVKVSGKLRLI